MKLTKIFIAIAWLFFNIIVVLVIFFLPKKDQFCLEMHPPKCVDQTGYGWPKENFLQNHENKKWYLNEDNIRTNGLILALLIIPSMGVAFLLGSGLDRNENNRD